MKLETVLLMVWAAALGGSAIGCGSACDDLADKCLACNDGITRGCEGYRGQHNDACEAVLEKFDCHH